MRTNYIITLALFLCSGMAQASVAMQDSTRLRQEVEVVKDYQPSISDAFKINDIPKIETEPPTKPTFEYSILSRPYFSTFDPQPIQAARMVGEPRPEPGNGLLKLGAGNYLTPYGELFFNSKPGRNSNFGMHFKHLSSHGKIKLLNDDKVEAPQSENLAELFGQRFFTSSTLSGKLSFSRDAFRYYGYTGEQLSDSLKEIIIPMWNSKQAFSRGMLRANLTSNERQSDLLKYDFGLNYQLFGSRTGQTEHLGQLSASLRKGFDALTGHLDAGITYYRVDSILKNVSSNYGARQQIVIQASPAVSIGNNDAKLRAGLHSFLVFDDDADASLTITPNILGEWSPVDDMLTLYAGANGFFKHNTYSSIASQNRFVHPAHDTENTIGQYVLSTGIKGKFSSKTNYHAGVTYSGIKSDAFFYLNAINMLDEPTSDDRVLHNTFDLIYDDTKELKLSAEVFHAASQNLNLRLTGNYYSYNTDQLEKALNRPNFDLTASLWFQTESPLSFTVDAFLIGKRTGLIRHQSGLPGNLSFHNELLDMDPVIDLNAGIQYQFNSKVRFWGKINNFAYQQYEYWQGYTNQGLNVLAGISVAF